MCATPEEVTLNTPYQKIAAKRWRQSGGIPTMGLHGWLDNASTFDNLAPLLPGLELVSIDLPGHGRSTHRPPGMRYHYTDYVDDVMAVADALQWERFTLLGHSMGAGIACLAAGAFPDRVANLVLIEGMGAVTGESDDVADALRRAVRSMRPDRSRPPAAYPDMDVLVRARAAAGKITHASAARLVKRAVKRDAQGLLRWRSDPRLTLPFPQYFTNALMLAFLEAIAAPVLLVTAEDGMLPRRPYYTSRRKAIRNLQHVHLPGNHHLHMDAPIPVAAAINRFFKTELRSL
jgi:pimeloyl-ACP methyl ester carboxylesterase